jgi:hypothetical protein
MRKLLAYFSLFSFVLSALSYAQLQELTSSVGQLCFGMQNLLPVVSMLMVTVGAVVYAAGQIMGAETRARANVWATAALTGAVTAMLIASISPSVLAQMYPGLRTDCSFVCKGRNPDQNVPPGGSCCATKCASGGCTPGYQWVCPAGQSCKELAGGIGSCV